MTISAINSVLQQTLSDLELIIIDDGSTDGLLDALAEIWRADDRVTVLRYRENSGLPALRVNSGLLRAKAEIVGYQFEDDLYEIDALERLLQNSPGDELFMTYGVSRYLTASEDGEWIESGRLGDAPFNFGRIMEGNYIANNSVIHSRKLFELAGMYDPHIVIRRASDYDLWVRFARVVTPIWHPEVVSSVRVLESHSLGANVSAAQELYIAYRQRDRSEALSPHRIQDFDVLDSTFATSPEILHTYRNDVLAPFVAQHWRDVGHNNADALLIAGLLRLAVAMPDYSTSIDVTIGNFAQEFPDTVQFGFFSERQLPHLYDPEYYDVLVQYRTVADSSGKVAKLARAHSKAVVYLMDDNMLRIFEVGPEFVSLNPQTRAYTNIKSQIQSADLTIVYSPQLAHDCGSITDRIAILSTNIPRRYIAKDTCPSSKRKVRFALLSGTVRLPEIEEIWPELKLFFQRNCAHAELIVWGLDPDSLPDSSVPSEIIPFNHNYRNYLERLNAARFDYLLCPLHGRHAAKLSKSPVKFLEATAAGAVLIASDVEPYQVVQRSGSGILVPWSSGAWDDALERALHLSPQERNSYFAAAKREVDLRYTTESQITSFVTALQQGRVNAHFRGSSGDGERRIAYFFRETLLGGATLHLLAHAEMMHGLGYSIVLCVPTVGNIDSGFAFVASQMDQRVVALDYITSLDPQQGDANRAKLIAGFLQCERIGLVHGTPYSGDWILAANLAEVPITLSLHQCYSPRKRISADLAPNSVHCSSRHFTHDWSKKFRVRCTSMPVPVPLETFSVPIKMPTSPGSRINILVTGTLQPRKGQLNAVEAVCRWLQENRDVELTLAGYDNIEGLQEYVEAIRSLAVEFDAEDRIHILGFVREIDREFDAADILLCSSDDESMPQSIIHAMARGIPVVTAPVGGVREVVKDGFSGILCESNSPKDLAAGLRRALTMRPGQRETMLRSAREIARCLSGEDVVKANLLGIYVDAFENLSKHTSARVQKLSTELAAKERRLTEVEFRYASLLAKIEPFAPVLRPLYRLAKPVLRPLYRLAKKVISRSLRPPTRGRNS